MARVKKVDAKKDKTAIDFSNELDEFLSVSSNLPVVSLKEGGHIPYWINTGSYALNWVISNDFFKGVPGTRCILISGEPSTGKSFIVDAVLGHNIETNKGLSYKIDVENSTTFEFTAQIVGSQEIAEQIKLIQPVEGKLISIEKLTTIINKVIDYQASKKNKKAESIVVAIDSVTQLTSDKEVEIVQARTDTKKDKKDLTAAVKMRELFRTVEQKLPFANLTIVGIAQLTANIPASGFAPPGTPTKIANTKGSGFAFASSLTINMISNKEILDKKTETPIGIKMKLKTTKNRIKYKGRMCWLYFYFKKGIDKYGGLCELLANYGIIKASKVPSKGGEYSPSTTFKYKTDSGAELSFSLKQFNQIVESNGGEELLKEFNRKLNEVYEGILDDAGITDEDMLVEDPILDDENVEDEENEDFSADEE